MMVLRILHIISGVILGGYFIFMTLMVNPQLKKLSPSISMPVILRLGRVIPRVMGMSILVAFGTGTAMTWNIFNGDISMLFTSGSGLAFATGFVFTLATIILAFGFQTPRGIQMGKIGDAIKERAPTPQESQRLEKLEAEIEKLNWFNFAFIIITLASMLAARYL